MTILFQSGADRWADWQPRLQALLPGDTFVRHPDIGDPAAVEFAVVWKPPPGLLAALPNLKGILSLGAGVDHILADPALPPKVPVVRLLDPSLAMQMSEYVTLAVLAHHRRQSDYAAQQRDGVWRVLDAPDATRRRIGIMGFGTLGEACAARLTPFGFPIAGWVRHPQTVDGVDIFAGNERLAAFLARSDILVCLLPLTPATNGILNARTLGLLPKGAALINAARGAHLVVDDLLAALASGHLSGATLDVFTDEPLAADHPLWRHPKVTVTPHVAAITWPEHAAAIIAGSIQRLRARRPVPGTIDRRIGY
jgi:glyoxylate/hydroxypyruvate reductase A